MSDEKRCEWCRHFVYRFEGGDLAYHLYPVCMVDRNLIPCEQYEREPGADDDLWGGPAHMRQVEGEG